MESTNEANHWGYGPIDLDAFNADAAIVGARPQAANDIDKAFSPTQSSSQAGMFFSKISNLY